MAFLDKVKVNIRKMLRTKKDFSEEQTKRINQTDKEKNDDNETNKDKNPPTRLITGSQERKSDTEQRASMIDFIDMQNPDKILKKYGVDTYDKMEESDTHIAAVYQTRKLAISLCPWELIPADDSERSKMIRDFVFDVIADARGPFSENIRQLADAIGKGFAVLEIVWKLIKNGKWKGKFGIDEFIFHKQKFWRFTDKYARKYRVPIIYYIKDDFKYEGTNIPWDKIIVYTYNSQGSMYGQASFKPCYWQSWFKKSGWKSWMVFLDKWSFPVAVGTYPDDTPKPEQDILLEVLETIQRETCLVIPESMKVKFLEASRSGPISFRELIDACNAEISKCILGGTQTVQEGTRGSYALSRTHSDVRMERVISDTVSIADVIQQQAIKRIVDYSFKTDIYPQFVMRYPFAKQAEKDKDDSKGGRPAIFAESHDPFIKNIKNALLHTYTTILNSYQQRKDVHPINMKFVKKILLEKYNESDAYNISAKIKAVFENGVSNNSIVNSYEEARALALEILDEKENIK